VTAGARRTNGTTERGAAAVEGAVARRTSGGVGV